MSLMRVLTADANKVVEEDVLVGLSVVMMDYSDAFLAGGYLRDRLMLVDPRDVDIFTFREMLAGRTNMMKLNTNPEGVGQVFEGEGRLSPDATEFSDLGTGRVLSIEEAVSALDIRTAENRDHLLCPYPTQIIHLNSEWANPLDVSSTVAQFALGIQQVWYDSDSHQVRWTPAFQNDFERHTMTVCRQDNYERAAAVVRKFQSLQRREVYASWRMIVPSKWSGAYSEHVEFGTQTNVWVV